MGEGLNYLFNPPRSIAIIGATAREGGSVGGVITRNLLTKFRGGRVYLVNPSYTELLGHRFTGQCLRYPMRLT